MMIASKSNYPDYIILTRLVNKGDYMKRVALYMRVSSDQQVKEGDSIPAQRDALTKYAKENGYSIVGEYLDDGISGTKYSQRDELQRLLSDVQSGKIDLILITRLDRWFRSVMVLFVIIGKNVKMFPFFSFLEVISNARIYLCSLKKISIHKISEQMIV